MRRRLLWTSLIFTTVYAGSRTVSISHPGKQGSGDEVWDVKPDSSHPVRNGMAGSDVQALLGRKPDKILLPGGTWGGKCEYWKENDDWILVSYDLVALEPKVRGKEESFFQEFGVPLYHRVEGIYRASQRR